jgi:uncharacterized protein (DUF362 family)
MKSSFVTSRRAFLKTSLLGGLAAAAGGSLSRRAAAVESTGSGPSSRVALTTGDDRAENVFRGLEAFRDEIARAIGDRRVVVKPNNVSIDIQLSATHADCLEGILEFLESIGKSENVVIAESAANGPTMEGFANYGYPRLADKYGVKLADLDQQEVETVFVFDEKDFRPHPVRISRMLLDRDNFVISAAKLKTHDLVVATLSLKNIIFGAPIKDVGYRSGKRGKPEAKTDKPIAHGSGIYGINYNLFALAQRLHPHLAVIDGYNGMEGNGPTRGTPVDHRVCLVSPDWLAADRVAVELMGIDFAKIGYLNYCAQGGMGQGDLERIEILGEPLARHVRRYKLHDNVQKQLTWMTPPERE